MQQLAAPFPKPIAQVEPFVRVLGIDLTVEFLLRFGGSEAYFAANPGEKSAVVRLIGAENAVALAKLDLPRTVPLANPWLAEVLRWRGQSTAAIARTLRVTEATIRRWRREGKRV